MNHGMIVGSAVTLVATIGCLAASRMGHPTAGLVLKLTASTGFVTTAWFAGAWESNFGRCILLGLAFSWFGDLFLDISIPHAFLFGLTAFLLGHLSYCAAFLFHGVTWSTAGVGLAIVAIPVLLVVGWLWRHFDPGDPKVAVACYLAVITTMTVLAIGTWGRPAAVVIIAGALLFYVSDIFVARGAFASPGFVNRMVGLPLYFGGQIVLAWSVASANRE